MSLRTFKNFPRGQRKAKDQNKQKLFYGTIFRTVCYKVPVAKEKPLERKIWGREITSGHETYPAKKGLDKLPQIASGE